MDPELVVNVCPQCSMRSDSNHQYCPACGFPIGTLSPSPNDPFVGQTLPGGYHIVSLISVGGMGRIYRAEQSVLGRTVAVKIVHPHLLADENAALRFLTEARAASQLNHPNSIAVYDFGRTDKGQPYLVMEFLRGRDLARVLAEEGLLGFPRIVNILSQVLSALSEAHELGIVHRDLKPENIILEPLRRGGDLVKVLDFGLAKLRTDARAPRNVTSPGIVCGTPDYMAPEQGRGDPIDGRSDLYAVGIMLFQLLTGKLPFDADSATQIVLMHLTVPVPDPRLVAPHRSIPESLAQVVFRAMQKEARHRYQDAIEFSDALRQALELAETHPPLNQCSVRPRSIRPSPTVTCGDCGLLVPAGRFCMECGARLSTPSIPPIRASQVKLPLVLLGRDEDGRWLSQLLSTSPNQPRGARLVGENGVGKTRLLHELLSSSPPTELFVVSTGPDPYGAEVPFFALRDTIEQLAARSLTECLKSFGTIQSPVVVGLIQLAGISSDDDEPKDPRELRMARVETLRWAIARATERTSPRLVVIAVDDLHRVDGASRDTFAGLLESPDGIRCLLVATHIPSFNPGWPTRHPVRMLRGIPRLVAERLLRTAHAEVPLAVLETGEMSPLWLDQLLRYAQEGGSDPSARLADLIGQRLDTLPATARRTLQAIAVVADHVELDIVEQMVPHGDDPAESIETLVERGMVERFNEFCAITHPLLRDIVLAAIPAAVRRELHARALRLADRYAIPLEARAQFAFFAEDTFQALLLLEQVAERAAERRDTNVEVLALRRGLDLARQEISRGELEDPMRAVLIFSRKLGAALTRSGNLTDAEGVLREALDYATPSSSECAQLLTGLAHVAHNRERTAEALGYLERALSTAKQANAHDLVRLIESTRAAWTASAPAERPAL
jgi:serine/threonine protein kinase/tetratricopeptide (TPR) repeat protein